MYRFIAKSEIAKQVLKSAQIAASLPVNVIVCGEKGVGKRMLCDEISKKAYGIEALKLQNLIKENKINLIDYNEMILYNIENVSNILQLIKTLDENKIKVIATTSIYKEIYSDLFLITIKIPPLRDRLEDLEELKNIYLQEAKRIFFLDNILLDGLDEIDISQNALSLKKSIFKSILFNYIKEAELMNIIENFIYNELDNKSSYKNLIKIFEIPLLRAAKKKYNSQLQMANHLELNRITLRKKLDNYLKELADG